MDTDDAEGVLLGLACGDALGRPVEFESATAIERDYGRLTEMVGDGTWGQPPGTITDDTEQALCIARSLVERGQFDPEDIAQRFVDWYETGPFDIGGMTHRSLREIQQGTPWGEAGRDVWRQSPEGQNAGNGSVMRCPPVALPEQDEQSLLKHSRLSSVITHADPRCSYGAAVLNRTICAILHGESDPLATALDAVAGDAPDELLTALEPIADGNRPETLQTSGYVVHTLQTALYDGLNADSAEDGIVTNVNRGGDTDTIGAVTGSIVGARFGAASLPDRWLTETDESDELRTLARDLVSL